MPEILTKKQAIEFLQIDPKIFENYFKNADEMAHLPRTGNKGRFKFDKDALEAWKKNFAWRTVELTKEDYAACLDFALAQHFRSYVTSDWGTGRQREFGQKITNWMKGQLGEVALKKFLKREFGIDIVLDFEIREEIVPQDIIGVIENGKERGVKIGVGIKSSKPKSAYLVLNEGEINLEERRSEAYVYCRPDIPDDHLLRLTKDKIISVVREQRHFSGYHEHMPDLGNIFCEIAGWCEAEELIKVSEIPGQKFDGFRYVRKSGLLRRKPDDWKDFASRL